MRIMILHLSDMHFCGEVSFSEKNIQSIIRALNRSSSGIEHVLVIISGDLAYSGKKKQYDRQCQEFCVIRIVDLTPFFGSVKQIV